MTTGITDNFLQQLGNPQLQAFYVAKNLLFHHDVFSKYLENSHTREISLGTGAFRTLSNIYDRAFL